MKCIEDEIPFELPEGWEWCRLGNLSSSIQYGLSNSAESQGKHRLLRITDIQDGKVNWKDVPFTTVENVENYLLRKDDIVFARTGATVGKSFLITELPFESVFASYLIRIRLFDCISPSYLYQFFNSHCYWEQITDKSVGVGQPNCNGTSLKELFIPLPPLNEQIKIVPVANALLEYASVIESEKTTLQDLIKQTKSKILDLAIRGKLVPQDPNDEPASVLLERIRAEKEELIKQGKIKCDKKESIIFRGDDNSYYRQIGALVESISDWELDDLPDNWALCCLGELCDYGNCNNVEADSIAGDAWILDLEDIEKDTGKVVQKIRKNERDFTSTKHSFYEGQVLYSKLRPYLNKVIIADEDGFCTSEILPLEFANVVLPQYALYYLMSPTFLRYANQCSYGVKMPRLGTADGRKAIFPLPPIEEQHRIANSISRCFIQMDNILSALL